MRTFAWAGATVFVVSLLHFAWRYFDAFGVVVDAPMAMAIQPALINLGLFSAFALHHSLLARSGAKTLLARVIPPRLERSTYVWVASLLFLAVCAWWQPVPGLLWRAEGSLVWLLRALSIVGAWLTLQSAAALDMFDLVGTRPFMSPAPPATELKSTGPYGLVRHPIYLAWLFLVWTPTTMTGTRLVFAAVSTLYLVVAIPFEERSLHASIGPRYAVYVAAVRWRLVPWLY